MQIDQKPTKNPQREHQIDQIKMQIIDRNLKKDSADLVARFTRDERYGLALSSKSPKTLMICSYDPDPSVLRAVLLNQESPASAIVIIATRIIQNKKTSAFRDLSDLVLENRNTMKETRERVESEITQRGGMFSFLRTVFA
jgi:hypothetical protein